MKSFVLFLVLLALVSCSQTVTKPVTPVSEVKAQPKDPLAIPSKGVAFELLDIDQLTLQFKNLDSNLSVSIILGGGIAVHPLAGGHWELTGVEASGRSFKSMNISRKFVLTTKADGLNYGGSILLGCPKISPKDFGLLKSMKFFNRYPFSGPSGLCEVVVGNNFTFVKTELLKVKKSSKLNLHLSF